MIQMHCAALFYPGPAKPRILQKSDRLASVRTVELDLSALFGQRRPTVIDSHRQLTSFEPWGDQNHSQMPL